MRENKFRAWDKTNNEWYMNGDAFDLNFSGSYGDFFFDNDHPGNMRDVKLEWVQFTGLKDKNGKEIYEGDIDTSDDEYMYVVYDQYEAAFGLKYCKPVTMSADYINTCVGWKDLEITGNIYEHPELIDKKTKG